MSATRQSALQIADLVGIHGLVVREVVNHARYHFLETHHAVDHFRGLIPTPPLHPHQHDITNKRVQLGSEGVGTAVGDEEQEESRAGGQEGEEEEQKEVVLVAVANAVVDDDVVVIKTDDAAIAVRAVAAAQRPLDPALLANRTPLHPRVARFVKEGGLLHVLFTLHIGAVSRRLQTR